MCAQTERNEQRERREFIYCGPTCACNSRYRKKMFELLIFECTHILEMKVAANCTIIYRAASYLSE